MECLGCEFIRDPRRKKIKGSSAFEDCPWCKRGKLTKEEKEFERVLKKRLQSRLDKSSEEKLAQILFYLPNPNKKKRKRKGKRYKNLTPSIQYTPTPKPIEIPARESPRYQEWRSAILDRDKCQCALCGESRRNWIQAHHITRWIDNVSKRYDLRNGVALCVVCHHKNHNYRGQDFPQEITDKLINYVANLYEKGRYANHG